LESRESVVVSLIFSPATIPIECPAYLVGGCGHHQVSSVRSGKSRDIDPTFVSWPMWMGGARGRYDVLPWLVALFGTYVWYCREKGRIAEFD